MKKIIIPNIEYIKKQHYDYCLSDSDILSVTNNLSEEQRKLLFIEKPFDFSRENCLSLKYNFINKFPHDYFSILIKKYNKFRTAKNKKKWCGTQFIESLNIDVCPYCGMSYFSVVKKKRQNEYIYIAEAALDHYLPKEKFPYLALNLYNLIPSCSACNTLYKTTDGRKIINPYFNAVEDCIKFKLDSDDIINVVIHNKNINKIILENLCNNSNMFEYVDNHIEVLNLVNRYNKRTNIAKSLIKKKFWYDNVFINQLKNLDIGISECEFEDFIIKQDLYNSNEPFAKYKKVVWRQIQYN